MLLGLIFRGVAFEFRFKARADKRHLWDKAFIGGSLTATFFQGVALGAYIDGFAVVERVYVGDAFAWLTPFSLFCGLALIAAYALLGCTWLIMKTEGRLQRQMHDLARPLVFVVLAVTAIVSLWTPLAHAEIAARWFSLPNLFWFIPVPLLVLLCTWALLRAVASNAHYSPFLLTLALIFLGYSGLGISLWPHIIPPSISIWEAAAPPQSQGFILVGALFIIPFILMYTAWSYYVFRGKVTEDDGYH
ncbi:Cytochrome bd-I ubiquinol oxidase subunit 2 [compost metagenome]